MSAAITAHKIYVNEKKEKKTTYVAGGHARVDLSVHEIYPFTYVPYTLHNV
jgi:hypothetical protein